MKNQVAPDRKHNPKQPAKDTPRKEPPKARQEGKPPNQRDASDLPADWVFAT
ncbi:MAG: hypothetical protein V4501_12420 [Pseudomonadota bacterium]